MSQKTTAAIVLIALVGAIAFSVTGQEEPLPVVTPKATLAAIPLAEPTVALAAEPLIEFRQPTLVEAARNNDYVSFSALYAEAVKRGDDVSRFAMLHELWSYAVTDPIGAFYGADLYERLSGAHPGYAAYIAQYRIVDSRGNVFYPTSETRTFLLDRALEGRPAPPVQVAERAAAAPPSSRAKSKDPLPKRETSAVTETPAPAPQVAVHEPAAAAPAAVPVPVAAAPPVAAPVPTDTAIIATRDNPTGRGILLVIVGLIGVGLLALLLRTPAEQQRPMSIIQNQPPDNVEPLRKADAPASPPAAGTKAS